MRFVSVNQIIVSKLSSVCVQYLCFLFEMLRKVSLLEDSMKVLSQSCVQNNVEKHGFAMFCGIL